MPKILTEAEFHTRAQKLEQGHLSCYVIFKDNQIKGKIYWERLKQNSEGLPGWRLYLFDWTAEGSKTIQGIQTYGIGQDIQQLLMSHLEFGTIRFKGWDNSNLFWKDQLAEHGYQVFQVI